jgi:hypothetical protein
MGRRYGPEEAIFLMMRNRVGKAKGGYSIYNSVASPHGLGLVAPCSGGTTPHAQSTVPVAHGALRSRGTVAHTGRKQKKAKGKGDYSALVRGYHPIVHP